MEKKNEIKIFEDKQVRSVWDDVQEKWYISVVDVIAVLTESPNPRKYWSVLKTRLKAEGSQLATNCSQLKMPSADGKFYLTDVADTEQLFRLIQSIPSPKAEPFKQWLAQVAAERLDEMQDPELILNMLAEASTKDISAATNPEDYEESKKVAKQGGNVAKVARIELEAKTGKNVVTPLNAKKLSESGLPEFKNKQDKKKKRK